MKVIERIFLDFPDEHSYKMFLLNLRWNKYASCPFCKSSKSTRLGSPFRFHCNTCNTNYSITVNTIMHNTKVDLRKWLITLFLYLNDEKLSYRKLSKFIVVNKNTAYRLINRIQYLFSERKLAIFKIAGLKKDAVEIMSLMLLIDMGRSKLK